MSFEGPHAPLRRVRSLSKVGTPEDVSPHTLRHSVAYRMSNHEAGNTLYDVTKRLRHATIQTIERVYSHFDRV